MKTWIILGLVLSLIAIPIPRMVKGTTWIVDDPGDPAPTPPGTLTLRQAMNNASPRDRIWFNLPPPYVISLQSQLSVIMTDSLMIDGYSQWPASPGPNPPSTATILVTIDGTNAGPAHGFWIMASFDTIQGLSIVNFQRDGIRIEGTPQHTRNNVVYANFIGVDATGTNGQGNGTAVTGLWAGVDVAPGVPGSHCHSNLIGGNLIADNCTLGVSITACPPALTYSNRVTRNYIGLDVTGMAPLGNHGSGIYLGEGTFSNMIDYNVVSENHQNGIDIMGFNNDTLTWYTRLDTLQNNIIGLAADALTPRGNAGYGVSIGVWEISTCFGSFATNNVVGPGNVIAHNGWAGVRVWEDTIATSADSNRIDANSMYDNGLLGIDLGDNGITLNDTNDPDNGANQELNYPIITSANDTCGAATIKGTVDIPNPQLATVQIFRAKTDPIYFFGEGDCYLGSATPDLASNWSTVVSGLMPNDSVTATVIDVDNNTSEFSAVVPVQYTPRPIWVVDDPGDPTHGPAGTLTLREAIQQAESDAIANDIVFAIPGAGVHTISLVSPLPVITQDSLIIAGYTQSGASPGDDPANATIMIEIDGSAAGGGPGLWIKASHVIVEGLAIMNFEQDGIRIEGTPDSTAYNEVWGNFIGTDASGNLAQGNGTDPTGTWAGVNILCSADTSAGYCYCHHNVVAGNLISANDSAGVRVTSCLPSKTFSNEVFDNYIGTNKGGLVSMGNHGSGIHLGKGTCSNTVYSNVISGNEANGIDMVGDPDSPSPVFTSDNVASDNSIGLAADGTAPLPNSGYGISIGVQGISGSYDGFASGNLIGTGNSIAHNGQAGIRVWEHALTSTNADSNRITRNSIYGNSGLGIDLGGNGVTPNDSADVDTGPNQEQNYPVITSAVDSCGTTTITGTLGLDPPGAFVMVEIFKAQTDPTGFGEGEQYLSTTIASPASGDWRAVLTVLSVGDSVTATATASPGNTSEFSEVVKVEELPLAGIEEKAEDALGFSLALDGASPFHSEIVIRYSIARPGHVGLRVYGVSGELVRTLVSRFMDEGVHKARWDGKNDRGRAVASGIYFVELESGTRRTFSKILMLK